MGCITCGRNPVWRELSHAAAKSAGARLRRLGVLPMRVDWASRAALCEHCPLRVIRAGVSYCGQPYLEKIRRSPALDGCGCPSREKAKDPAEHCPLNSENRPARRVDGVCDCKWCSRNPNSEIRIPE